MRMMIFLSLIIVSFLTFGIAFFPSIMKKEQGMRKSSQWLKLDDSTQQNQPSWQPATPRDLAFQTIQKSMMIPSIAIVSSLAASVVAANAQEETKKKPKKPKVLETDLGIKYIELKKGSGPFPNDGDFVIISYNAFLNNGTLFDSTEAKGRKPITFRMGKKQIIPGLESVISYMQAGAEVTCSIPSQYAYGEKGVCIKPDECLVPPNENLKYFVKLISLGSSYN